MYDNWAQVGALFYHLPVSYSNEMMEKDVDQLLIGEKWNETKLRETFPKELVDHIISNIEVNASGESDCAC